MLKAASSLIQLARDSASVRYMQFKDVNLSTLVYRTDISNAYNTKVNAFLLTLTCLIGEVLMIYIEMTTNGYAIYSTLAKEKKYVK